VPQASEFTRGYNSFSGVDIKAVFAGKAIGTLQGISYSVSREKAPVYTMGSPDPRAFARGKRGIAGSLVFIQFDTEPLMYELANKDRNPLYFISDTDDLRPEFSQSADLVPVAGATVTPVGTTSPNAVGVSATNQESDISTVLSDQQAAVPWLADQIPPFDVVLSAANEYGGLAIMKILGCEIMNGGYGVSVDDIVSEHSYTYIAMGLVPWITQGRHPDANLVYGGSSSRVG
jgi:hypothetical protein